MDRDMMMNLMLSGQMASQESAEGQTTTTFAGNSGAVDAQNIAGYPSLLQQYFLQQQQQALLQQLQQQNQQQQQQQQMMGMTAAPAFMGGLVGGGAQMMQLPFAAGLMKPNPYAAVQQPFDVNNLLLQQNRQQQQQQQLLQGTTAAMGSGVPVSSYADHGLLTPWSATSASLMGNMAAAVPLESNTAVKTSKAGKKRKEKDKPKRPLSAYNIFFKEERSRILQAIPTEADDEDANADNSKSSEPPSTKAEGRDDDTNNSNNSSEKQTSSSKSGGPARKGRKVLVSKGRKLPHGKIGFESLAKMIGQRWKELDPEKITYYKQEANKDMNRYKTEMEVFLGSKQKQRQQMHDVNEPTKKKKAKKTKQPAKVTNV